MEEVTACMYYVRASPKKSHPYKPPKRLSPSLRHSASTKLVAYASSTANTNPAPLKALTSQGHTFSSQGCTSPTKGTDHLPRRNILHIIYHKGANLAPLWKKDPKDL